MKKISISQFKQYQMFSYLDLNNDHYDNSS